MSGRTNEEISPRASFRYCKAIGLLTLSLLSLAVVGLCAQDAPQTPQPSSAPTVSPAPASSQKDPADPPPIAIVSLDPSSANAAASVTGPIKASNGKAFIISSGEIAAAARTVRVTLPYRGTLNVCANTSIKLSTDTSVPASNIPGLLIALESGALEASFAIVKDSDIIQTPDFRILISGPGSADVKVRLGPKGDTCVDNPDANGSYVLVSSVFDGGAYRVQPGQRVMFQHGSLREVVDQEKEPCGCPPAEPQGNEFPLAQSEGLSLTPKPPAPEVNKEGQKQAQDVPPLVYNAPDHAPKAEPAAESTAPPPAQSAPANPAPEKKPGFFKRVGHFFGRMFGAES